VFGRFPELSNIQHGRQYRAVIEWCKALARYELNVYGGIQFFFLSKGYFSRDFYVYQCLFDFSNLIERKLNNIPKTKIITVDMTYSSDSPMRNEPIKRIIMNVSENPSAIL